MFCRIIFNKLKGYEKDKEIILTKNSKNNILHFSKDKYNRNFEFFHKEFLIKKLPKHKKKFINQKEVFLINLQDSSILIQPITDVYFLTLSDTGILNQINIKELAPGYHNVVRYDRELKDWFVVDVEAVNCVGNYNDIFLDTPELEEDVNDFNNYIIGTEENIGVILNDFMIM